MSSLDKKIVLNNLHCLRMVIYLSFPSEFKSSFISRFFEMAFRKQQKMTFTFSKGDDVISLSNYCRLMALALVWGMTVLVLLKLVRNNASLKLQTHAALGK